MAFYADFAGHYDKIFPFRPAVAAFLDHWMPATGRILDVGCGTGSYCAALDKTGRQTLGIDLDPGMIGEAALRILDHHKPLLKVARCVADILPSCVIARCRCPQFFNQRSAVREFSGLPIRLYGGLLGVHIMKATRAALRYKP